jgi:hypothetical protein
MRRLVLLLLVGVAVPAARATAQELEPGAYTVSPVGFNILNVGYSFNTGDVNFDPSLPVEQASATIHSGSVSVGRSMDIFGRSATALVALPIVDGHVEGLYVGQFVAPARQLAGVLTVGQQARAGVEREQIPLVAEQHGRPLRRGALGRAAHRARSCS